MKKIFAIFCSICLMPAFSAQAWIGGPFSNNSYFGENGDDGVYEAVAFPVGGAVGNGIGIFRWGVGNSSSFSSAGTISVSQVIYDNQGNVMMTLVDVRPVASNIYFGGTGQISHSWFIEGVAYRGNCDGVVNSGLNIVSCVGTARNPIVNANFISSGFEGTIDNKGKGLPITRFSGYGQGQSTVGGVVTDFDFVAFGSKVSNGITVNGNR
ncbi:MAG TPA: hypothetical protein PLA50_02155 [Bacteroidia bacterium]|nr:hypothetical protein [Bacteroidia bacterium]